MTISSRLTLIILAVCGFAGQAQENPREIFYAPFEGSANAVYARGQAEPYQARVDRYEPGIVGQAAVSEKRYNGIRYDGRGNIDLDRGTLAFFYKPLFEPGVSAWLGLSGVSTDIEGYWSDILKFLVQQENFQFRFYDVGRYSPQLTMPPVYKRWKQGEWHHLAAVWDRHEGISVYEDGKKVASNWGQFSWEWSPSPRTLVFGEYIYSTNPFALDEVHIYADPLTDEQIAQLAKGEKPSGRPIPAAPEEKHREADLARMGWDAAGLVEIQQVVNGEAVRHTMARIVRAVDAKRSVAQPFEGLWNSCWPQQKYGASRKGQLLELRLAPGQSFDRARMFVQREFAGSFNESVPGQGLSKLLDIKAPHSLWRGHFASPRSDASVFLKRTGGILGQVDFYRAEKLENRSSSGNSLVFKGMVKMEKMPPTQAGRATLAETPTRFDNPVRATSAECEPWVLPSPAFGGFQLITEPLAEPLAIDGVSLVLVLEELKEPTPIQIKIKEPIFTERNWLVADAVLIPKGGGKQTFTIEIKGRPVINSPGMEVAAVVVAANPLKCLMGKGGTIFSLCLADIEKAKPIAIEDQIEFAREAYAEINEGHVWDCLGEEGWGRLYYPLKWLEKFAPAERPTMEMLSRVKNWRKEPLPWPDEPKNTTGAPDWAFWQMEALKSCKKIVRWIIDNRQIENGEFGGVWGDDTDMTEYWPGYVLCGDDDHKIRDSLRLFWKNLYQECLVDGVSRTIRDALHSYEEGMGSIAGQMLVDYGDPVSIEHVMRASSHYDKWMARNPDDSYRFLGNYLGAGGVWTEGDFGKDKPINNLMLIPAGYLVWYNRQPTVAPYVKGWPLVKVLPSIACDAALRLEGDEGKMRAWYEETAARMIKERKDIHAVANLLDETPVKEEWKKNLMTLANNMGALDGKLPEYAGYSPIMTEGFWLAYMATGDIKYLTESYKQACRFINNQEWLYTVSQPSCDRIPLPETTLWRARLGSFVTKRGGTSSNWPRYGISYPGGAEQVAALVTANTDQKLTVKLHCFSEKEHALQVRVWRLDPGTYNVTLTKDTGADGKPAVVISENTMELDRGAFIDLKLPPLQGSILNITAVKTGKPVYDLPDPAISSDELFLEYGDHLHVTVHNIGTKPVENLLVRVIDGNTMKVVAEKTVKRIDPPLDLQPKTALIEFQNMNAITKKSIIVQLDPDKKHPDLNRHNNEAVYIY
jgi:hypothetical protein